MSLLELKQLTKNFGGLVAVDSLSFSLAENETVSIIGPNGAGKTTVFDLITGFQRPTGGKIFFDGREITGCKPHQIALAGIGRTFQIVKPLQGLTVFENVMAGAFARTRERKQAHQIADDAINFCGLSPLRERPAFGLSIAMRKRLELARSIATRPRLILLDEVMAGLNPSESRDAIGLIKRLKNERGVAAIAGVEHVMRIVMTISDRVIVLNHGRKIAEGTPDEIAANAEVIRAYLGD